MPKGLIACLLLGAVALSAGTAAAAVNAYLEIDGIKGPATAHTDAIEISSFQWGVGRGIGSPMGGSSDRESSAPSVSEIVVTKNTDSASPLLVKAAAAGRHFPKVVLYVRKAGGEQEYQLTNAWITGLQAGPPEHFTLNFTKIQLVH